MHSAVPVAVVGAAAAAVAAAADVAVQMLQTHADFG